MLQPDLSRPAKLLPPRRTDPSIETERSVSGERAGLVPGSRPGTRRHGSRAWTGLAKSAQLVHNFINSSITAPTHPRERLGEKPQLLPATTVSRTPCSRIQEG